jgi:hypothetical protein
LFTGGGAPVATPGEAWCAQAIASQTLQRNDGSRN